jgi:hypothetical protein
MLDTERKDEADFPTPINGIKITDSNNKKYKFMLPETQNSEKSS